jgi:hypothetical protein
VEDASARWRGVCFAYAPVANPPRDRAEAALIYKHKPAENTE